MTLQEKCELLKKGLENLEYIDTEINGMEWQQITPSHNFVMLFYDYYELREKPKEAKEIFVNVYDDNSLEIFDTLKESVYRKEWGVIKRFKGVEQATDGELWTLLINDNQDYRIYNRLENDFVYQNGKTLGSYKKYALELLYEAEPEKQYPCRECGTLRTKAEGGTVFTLCDECFDKLHTTPEIPNSVLDDYLPPEKPEEIELLKQINVLKKKEYDKFQCIATNRDKINELTVAVNKLIERSK